MKIHPREQNVRSAEAILYNAILEARKCELTDAEYLQVLNRVFSESIASYCKFWIREERHGDMDKPGCVE